MSGGSRDNYSKGVVSAYEGLTSNDSSRREEEERNRRVRLERSRREIHDVSKGVAPERPEPVRETREVYDASLARNRITAPAAGVKRVHILLIDNSGSNRANADHLKKTSGYLLASLGAIDPQSQMAVRYFSDHSDGDLYQQDVDYHSPNEQGDKILHSSTARVLPTSGHDEAEAIECVLWDACDLDFGGAQERHLYLVTDVVGHGMGLSSDVGCVHGRKWEESLQRVKQTFTTFQVIGCANDSHAAKLQRKFVDEARDLIDLSEIESEKHRRGIIGNAFLFLAARNRGPQDVEAFLKMLYEKWLAEPIFGANTDLNARQAITRFTKFLDLTKEAQDKLLAKIFG